ncbi:unnamed protein product, partial [Mesorhabditis spiculigera]
MPVFRSALLLLAGPLLVYGQQYYYPQYYPQYQPQYLPQQYQQFPQQQWVYQQQQPVNHQPTAQQFAQPPQSQQMPQQPRPPPAPENFQYLSEDDPSKKARRFIASYWDPQRQQTVYYERNDPVPNFQARPQFPQQFQQAPEPAQTPRLPFLSQQPPPQRILDPRLGQAPPPPPPQAFQPQQPATHTQAFREQQAPAAPRRTILGQGTPRAPPPPGKFSPYPQDLFNPLDAKVARPTPPEILVVGGSQKVEHSLIEEVPAQTLNNQRKPQPPTHFEQPKPIRPETPVRAPAPKNRRPVQQPARSHLVPAPRVELSEEIGEDANAIFLTCCKKRNVAKKCESRCDFDVMNKKMLTAMFLGTDPCPQAYGRDLLTCAAQDLDHSQCCIEKGVHETSAGNKCLGFCNMTPGTTFQADVSMLPCWAVLNDIKSCFRSHIEDNMLSRVV